MAEELSKEPTEAQAPAQGEAAAVETQPADKPAESKPEETKAEPAKSILDEGENEEGADKAQPKAPEAYEDFKMPEGVQVDTEALTEFAPLAKELNLSQEQAQKLVDLYAKAVVKGGDQQVQAWNAVVDKWTAELKADAEFGGGNLKANTGMAVKALKQFGTPELRQYLDQTRIVNNPELFKFLARVGKAISEDKALDGGPAKAEVSAAHKLYPNMK